MTEIEAHMRFEKLNAPKHVLAPQVSLEQSNSASIVAHTFQDPSIPVQEGAFIRVEENQNVEQESDFTYNDWRNASDSDYEDPKNSISDSGYEEPKNST